MFGFVKPESMHPPVIRSIENFFLAVTVQVDGYRVGLAVFDDAIVLAEWRPSVYRWAFPVPAVFLEPAPVGIEDLNPVIFSRRMALFTVIDVAGHDHFIAAVSVHIGYDTGSVGKIGSIPFRPVARTVSPAAKFRIQAFPDADPPPFSAVVH